MMRLSSFLISGMVVATLVVAIGLTTDWLQHTFDDPITYILLFIYSAVFCEVGAFAAWLAFSRKI